MSSKCRANCIFANVMKIKFYLRTTINPAPIYARVTNGRKFDITAPIGLFINYEDWNSEKGIPRKSSNIKEFQLKSIEAKILANLNENSDVVYDSKWLKNIFSNDKATKNTVLQSRDYLINFFNEYLTKVKSNIELNKLNSRTYEKYERVKVLIEEMQAHYNKQYKVKDVDLKFIERFESFCFDEKKFSKNYVGRIIKFIKTVVRDARISGIETHYQLDAIKGYTEKTVFVVLSEEEITQIKNATLPINHIINDARDWLLISCYTGQRVSDFLRFTSDMIIQVKDNENQKIIPMIRFVQLKTKKEIDFPISSEINSILNKRNGEFPQKLSDQLFNKLIKEVCKIAGITQVVNGNKENPKTKRKVAGKYPKYELISSHIGRRTFCTNNYGKIPTPFIMYASGHSTETMLLKYINKTNTQNSLELAKYLK